MRMHVRSRGFELTDALRAHAERRPRGGADKRCQIVARLGAWGEVRVQELDEDVYAAISRAADRLDRAVAREMERRREIRSYPANQPR